MTGKEKIQKTSWANCYICEKMFARKRETARYCSQCENAFCEGEHGTFSNGIAHCVIHTTPPKEKINE
jgi:hypothetical protein